MARSVTSVTRSATHPVGKTGGTRLQAKSDEEVVGKTVGDNGRETVTFNQKALQEEIRKCDEAATRWKTARDEVYRLLRDDASDLRELIAAETYAEHCAEELRVQQVFVRWCREWVEKETRAQAPFQTQIDQLRPRYAMERSRSGKRSTQSVPNSPGLEEVGSPRHR